MNGTAAREAGIMVTRSAIPNKPVIIDLGEEVGDSMHESVAAAQPQVYLGQEGAFERDYLSESPCLMWADARVINSEFLITRYPI